MPRYLIEKHRDGIRVERSYRSRSDSAGLLAYKWAYDSAAALALLDRPAGHDAVKPFRSYNGKETVRVEIGGLYRVSIVRLN